MSIRWPAFLAVAVVVVICQTAWFDQIQLLGGRADLPLLLVVGIGFSAREEEAALQGFVVGLLVDLFQFGPFGLHALVYCLAGWFLSVAWVRMLQASTSFRTVQGAAAVALVTALTWFAGGTFGQDPPRADDWLPRLFVAGVIGGTLVHPAARVGKWLATTHLVPDEVVS